MAAPLHRHQSSLEGILNFSSHPPPLETELRNHASRRFHDICQHFDTGIPVDNYSRPRLVRFTYEYSLSQESRDYFLRVFFRAVDLQIDRNAPISFEDVRSKFFQFGDHLFDNFFLPIKASTKKTPQPSPALHSAVQEVQGQSGQQYVGTGPRLSVLRRDCLIRDRYRCVISRKFDFTEAIKRSRTSSGGPRDDEGNLIANDPIEPAPLEVAHILPHSLTKMNEKGELDVSKQSALAVLDMFDIGVAELIQGPEIDRPRNALTLTRDFHQYFGDFQVYFEPVPNRDHVYTVRTHVSGDFFFRPTLPITRELYLTPDRTIEPPSRRLLAIHCAIAHILHLSGAGEYIDKMYRDMEEIGVQADGSTPLGRFVSLAISEQSSPVCT